MPGCEQGPTRERALQCGGALERGDGATPEPLAQLGDALGGVQSSEFILAYFNTANRPR